MPRIHTITTDTVISDNDLILGTDGAQGANNATKNFSFGVFKNYLWTNVTFTGDLNVSGGDIILDNNKFLQSKLTNGTVIDLIGINGSNVVKIAQDNQPVTFGTGDVNIAGNLVGAQQLTITGNSVLGGTLQVNGNTTLGNAAGDTITFTGTPTFNAASTFNNTITVGANGTGHAITIHSAATGRALTYDPTNDSDGMSKLMFGENMKAQFGTNTSDLAIYNNDTSSFIDAGTTAGHLYIRNRGDQKDIIFQAEDGETNNSYETYFMLDGSLSEAGTAGVNYTRWPDKASAAYGDVIGGELHGGEIGVYNKHLNIQHMIAPAQTEKNINIFNYSNDGDIKIATDNGTGGTANYIVADGGTGAVELYWYGNKKLHTTTTGIQVTGSINMNGAYTLAAADGNANQVLTTNGSGVTSWQDVSGLSQFVVEGSEFTNSLILGHTTTGTLDAALGNTGVGVGAMNAITSGDHNVALGHDALGALTTGANNVGVGKQAMFTNIASHSNVAIGKDALYTANTTDVSNYPDNGSKNVAIGFNAGSATTTGKENVYIGYEAGKTFTSGNKNICIGHGADANGSSHAVRFNTIAIGYNVKVSKNNTITIGSSDYDQARILALHDGIGTFNSATTTLTASDSGKTYEAAGNPSGGYTVTLPDAGGVGPEGGWHVEFQISTDPTNNLKVVADNTSTDKLIGYVQCINASTGATSIFRAQSSDNYSAITFNGTSQGTIGSHIKIKKGVFSDRFNISGTLICTTTPANPFSTT